MRADVPPRRALRVRALLRAARGRLRLQRPRPRIGEAKDPGRLRGNLALRGLPAVRGRAARRAQRDRARADAPGARRPARGAARPRRGVDQERRREPDALVQGPRRRRRARQGEAAGLRHGRLRFDRQPRECRRRARGLGGPALVRLRSRRPRGAEAARDRRLRHDAGRGRRQLRRRQPPLHAALRGARVGVRQRQPAPLLRRGLEDARLRDRRATRLDAPRPRRLPDRVGLAVLEARPRVHRVARAGARQAASCRRSTAPRPRAAARSRARSPTATTPAVRSSPTRSPRASRSATRPTGPTRSTSRAAPAARSSR